MNREEDIRVGHLIRAITNTSYWVSNLIFSNEHLGRCVDLLDNGVTYNKCDLYYCPNGAGYLVVKYGDGSRDYLHVGLSSVGSISDPIIACREWFLPTLRLAKEKGCYQGNLV